MRVWKLLSEISPFRWSTPKKIYRCSLEKFKAASPQLIVVEAAGGLEGPLVACLAGAELPVAVVNPRQAGDFANATGRLAKTYKIDAKTLQAIPQPGIPGRQGGLRACFRRTHRASG